MLTASLGLRGRTAPGRVLFGPLRTNLCRDGLPTARLGAFYAARAAGGAGVIVAEHATVRADDMPYERVPRAHLLAGGAPGAEAAWTALAAACRPALAIASLRDTGGEADGSLSQAATWSPSGFPDVASREVPKVMEEDDCATVMAAFAAAASALLAAGFDGVEVHAGVRSLLRQFLSPLTNFRDDGWGGDAAGRARLCTEVLGAVRAAIGADAVLGLRLSVDENAPWGGITPEAAGDLVPHVLGETVVDYVVATSGGPFTPYADRASMYEPAQRGVPLAGALRAALPAGTALIAQGSIVDPEAASAVLADGTADLVEMTRALIADPHLPALASAGRLDEVRPCLLCNQDCFVHDVWNPEVACIHNPDAGHETEPRAPADAEGLVVVVGAGPAGLAAAAAAAARGCEVRVFDASGEPGGAIGLLARIPGRGRFQLAVAHLVAEARRAGAQFHLGEEVGAEEIVRLEPRAVIVASGGRARAPLFDAAPDADVRDVRAVIDGALPAGDVILVDTLGGTTVGVVEMLAAGGANVTLVTEDLFCGQGLARTGEIVTWKARAAAAGVATMPMTRPVAVTNGELEVEDRFGAGTSRLPADTVVVSASEVPADELFHALAARGVRVLRAGDAVAPRRLVNAVREGRHAGDVA